MTLTVYLHPMSSFCQKVLIALYESGAAFEPVIVDLGNETSRGDFLKIWPIGKFPVLRDEARDRLVPESSIIIEYLALHHPGRSALMSADAETARDIRLLDRFYDHYVSEPMQKIVGDRLRPAGQRDAFGVAAARAGLNTAYALIDAQMATRTWALGADFTMADCSAAPALFYAEKVQPFRGQYPNIAAYFDRLQQRPSYARVLCEAEPYLKIFPEE
ncbi:MAG: glutathione S-transferase [Hydrocarboniphaga sp.]|uniref:glutathione S-transferase family protein n=1 Tax=Hydrocarboniphaga sp. TaxID=2033016 RepID=UPI00261492E6|nr:glutathione S-transferase family protein [Hydrocarboniphaga sp.]MDB5970847.1 glutathione S-transferase [Hydrocarboniphaga sp.]